MPPQQSPADMPLEASSQRNDLNRSIERGTPLRYTETTDKSSALNWWTPEDKSKGNSLISKPYSVSGMTYSGAPEDRIKHNRLIKSIHRGKALRHVITDDKSSALNWLPNQDDFEGLHQKLKLSRVSSSRNEDDFDAKIHRKKLNQSIQRGKLLRKTMTDDRSSAENWWTAEDKASGKKQPVLAKKIEQGWTSIFWKDLSNSSSKVQSDRDVLFESIRKGKKLNHAPTNDKSSAIKWWTNQDRRGRNAKTFPRNRYGGGIESRGNNRFIIIDYF